MVTNNKNDNRKKKKKQINGQLMHNAIAHLLLTDSRPSFPNLGWTLLGNSPSLYHGMLFCGVKYPFGLSRSPVPVVLPPSFFCALLTGRAWAKGEKKSLWLRRNMTSRKTKTSVCDEHHSHSESQMQHCNRYWEKMNSALAKTRTFSYIWNLPDWLMHLLLFLNLDF